MVFLSSLIQLKNISVLISNGARMETKQCRTRKSVEGQNNTSDRKERRNLVGGATRGQVKEREKNLLKHNLLENATVLSNALYAI